MKSINLWIALGTIGLTLGLAGGAWCETTGSDLTISSVKVEPSTITNSVTTDETDNTPAAAVDSTSSGTSDPDSDTDAPEVPIPSINDDSGSKTISGPLGVTHTQTTDKSTTEY
jgi:hypothetical protein